MKNITPKKITFSKVELEHLWKSWLVISLAFAVAMSIPFFISLELVTNFIVAGLTVGLGFLFHEMGHKFMAQRYQCYAEYRANFQMLFLALVVSFLGFVFAAPGAVVIDGYINRKQRGIISLAGPLINTILAALFLPLIFFVQTPLFYKIVLYGFNINIWIALFNMLPFGMFDGRKVIAWDKGIYFAVIGGIVLLRVIGSALIGS